MSGTRYLYERSEEAVDKMLNWFADPDAEPVIGMETEDGRQTLLARAHIIAIAAYRTADGAPSEWSGDTTD